MWQLSDCFRFLISLMRDLRKMLVTSIKIVGTTICYLWVAVCCLHVAISLALAAAGVFLKKYFSTDRKDDNSTNDLAQIPSSPLGEWKLVKEMGTESTGYVFCAMDSDGFVFCVKKIRKVLRGQPYEKEVEFLRACSHSKIIQFYGTAEDEEHHFIITELMPLGSLSSMIFDAELALTEIQTARYIQQLLEAVDHLHHNHIIHRDIKGANILVGPGGMVKLRDLGSAIKMTNSTELTDCVGSLWWMAPEVRHMQLYGTKVDIWSLGCTVVELLWGKHPFFNMRQLEVFDFIQMGDKPPLPAGASRTAADFVRRCLRDRAAERPTASELLKHPFITHTN
ncbi:hypothetical protein LUZ63_014611 [Rhynchospora breviuscula]|uniref:Protein kinase domain-containing protein n=1 Tax=Rhynchospora breviuscula TaxID=2022672 RepID=A0A9Q0CAR4_9POAL|nr:hypothetical protein LUZ63_014611 [Rhynchospora breviuscula]